MTQGNEHARSRYVDRRPRRVAFLRMATALCMLSALCALLPASAATRAWLDRATGVEGEPVTLNIETDQQGVAPDYTPLQRDFALGTPFRSRTSGGAGQVFGIALTPRRSGLLEVPPIRVGREASAPMRLQVDAAPAAASSDAQVFVESSVDDAAPYVQQSVGVTVRLHYAVPLLSGELTQDAPAGASLQRVGDDVQSTRQIGNRRFNVVERRYLLVPERSGPLQLPAARFRGQAAGGFFDDMFGERRELSAQSAPRQLQVAAQPAAAAQPWLPLHGLRLRYVAAPQQARAGEAVELVVEAVAQGGTQALFPELPVPELPGVQVFAEPAQFAERFVDGAPELTVTRRFALVPGVAGGLRIPGPALSWWDVGAGAARRASLPPLTLEVAPAAAVGARAPARHPADVPPPADDAIVAQDEDAGAVSWPWHWIALGLALLWLATLGWALHLRRQAPAGVLPASGPVAGSVPVMTQADLRRALDAGSFEDVVACLRRMRSPMPVDLDALLVSLDDAAQREALERMRRALWADDGAPADARAALRSAFRTGPVWRAEPAPARAALPPLYPERAGRRPAG